MSKNIEILTVRDIAKKTLAYFRVHGFEVTLVDKVEEQRLSCQTDNSSFSIDFWVLRRRGGLAQESLFLIQGRARLQSLALTKQSDSATLKSLVLDDSYFDFGLRHLLPEECGSGGAVFDAAIELKADVDGFCNLLCINLHQLLNSFETGEFFTLADLKDERIFGFASDFFAKKVLGAWSLGRPYTRKDFEQCWAQALGIERNRFPANAVLRRMSIEAITREHLRKTQRQQKALLPFVN